MKLCSVYCTKVLHDELSMRALFLSAFYYNHGRFEIATVVGRRCKWVVILDSLICFLVTFNQFNLNFGHVFLAASGFSRFGRCVESYEHVTGRFGRQGESCRLVSWIFFHVSTFYSILYFFQGSNTWTRCAPRTKSTKILASK